MMTVADADVLNQEDLAILAVYAKSQDPSVLDDVVERYQALVQATCWQILGNQGLAEDAAQETLILFMRHAGDVHSSVPGWLHRTATTTALQIRRREAARGRRESVLDATDIPCHPGDDVTGEVHELLVNIPAEDRDLIIRHYLMGQSQQVLAEMLGVSQSAISRRIESALERLRERQRADSPARRLALLPLLFSYRPDQATSLDAQVLDRTGLPSAKAAMWVTVSAVVCMSAGAYWWFAARPSPGLVAAADQSMAVINKQEPAPASVPAAVPTSAPTDTRSSFANSLRWQHIAVEVNDGRAFIVQDQVLPPNVYLEGRSWRLREDHDSLMHSILVSDLPQVPLSFNLSLFYESAGALSFCDPIQRDPSLMPKGAWSVDREPFVSNPAAGPYPGRWHFMHAEVTFQTDAGGQPITEIRRWCDGVEYTSTRHPGHPLQISLVGLERGTGQFRDLHASRLALSKF